MFYLTTQSASIHICWHLAFQRHSERCGQKTICSPACQCGSLAEIHDASKSITNYIYLRIIKKYIYISAVYPISCSVSSRGSRRDAYSPHSQSGFLFRDKPPSTFPAVGKQHTGTSRLS